MPVPAQAERETQASSIDRDALRTKIQTKTSAQTKSTGFQQQVKTQMRQPKPTQTPEQHVKLLEALSALVVARYQLILQKELTAEERNKLERVVLPSLLTQLENNVLHRPISQAESQNLVESLAQKLAVTRAQQTGESIPPPTSEASATTSQIYNQLQMDLAGLLQRPLDQNEADLIAHSILSSTNKAVATLQSHPEINTQALSSRTAADPRMGQFNSALDAVVKDTGPSADRENPAWQQARTQVASQYNQSTEQALQQQLQTLIQQYETQNNTKVTDEQKQALMNGLREAYIDSRTNQMLREAKAGGQQSKEASELAFAKDFANNFTDTAVKTVGGLGEAIVKPIARNIVSWAVQGVLDAIEDVVVDVVLDVVVDVVVDVILDAVIEVIATAIGACFCGVGSIVGAAVGAIIDVIVDAIVDVVLDVVLDVVVDAVIAMVNKMIGHIASKITDKVVDMIFKGGEHLVGGALKGGENVAIDALGPQLQNMIGNLGQMGGSNGSAATGQQQISPEMMEQVKAALASSGQSIDQKALASKIQAALSSGALGKGQATQAQPTSASPTSQTPPTASAMPAETQAAIAGSIDKAAITQQIQSALGGALDSNNPQPAAQTPATNTVIPAETQAAIAGNIDKAAITQQIQSALGGALSSNEKPAPQTQAVVTSTAAQTSGGMTRPPPSQGFEKIEQKVAGGAQNTRITSEPAAEQPSPTPGPTRAA